MFGAIAYWNQSQLQSFHWNGWGESEVLLELPVQQQQQQQQQQQKQEQLNSIPFFIFTC
jgi:hypothetical protein